MPLSAHALPSSRNANTQGGSLASYYGCDKHTVIAQLSQNAKFHSKGKGACSD